MIEWRFCDNEPIETAFFLKRWRCIIPKKQIAKPFQKLQENADDNKVGRATIMTLITISLGCFDCGACTTQWIVEWNFHFNKSIYKWSDYIPHSGGRYKDYFPDNVTVFRQFLSRFFLCLLTDGFIWCVWIGQPLKIAMTGHVLLVLPSVQNCLVPLDLLVQTSLVSNI